MSHTPNYDAKIKALLDATPLGERTCPLTGETWNFDERELAWCRQFNAPRLDYSPRTQMKILGGFRSMFEIFWNKHAFSGESILAYVHPDSPVRVVSDLEAHEFDPTTVSSAQADIDLTVSTLSIIQGILPHVPIGARREWRGIFNTIGVGLINVEDSYMVFSAVQVKRCLYCYYALEDSEDMVQSIFHVASTNCFGCSQVNRMYSCVFAIESRDCMNGSFIYDCRNCEYVFGGVNLRNKKYIWFNEQLTKEEWEQKRSAVDLSCWSVFEEQRKALHGLIAHSVIPENFNHNSPDCTGEYLIDCVRSQDCFYCIECTDCFHLEGSRGGQSCAYVCAVWPASNTWMSAVIEDSNDVKYSFYCSKSQGIEYCYNCHDCEYLFGCVGLHKKKFHIFNKPYTEEEYWKKVDALKCGMLGRGEYGMFFDQEWSPAGMQFSHSAFWYEMSEEEMRAFGAPMYDPDRGAVLAPKKGQEMSPLNIADVPDCIGDVEASEWVGKPFMDQEARRRWAVVPQEFAYLKAHKLPFPREHYSSRLRRQIQMLNLIDTEETICASCQKHLRVHKNKTFKNRKIYCQLCYLKYLETR